MNANTIPTISTLINNTLPLEGVAVSNTRNYGWLNQQIQTLLAGNPASGIPTVADVQASSCLRGRSESETLLLVLQGLLQLVGGSDGSNAVRSTPIIGSGNPNTLKIDGVKGQLYVDISAGNGALYVNTNNLFAWSQLAAA
jgi:hypothetical protein